MSSPPLPTDYNTLVRNASLTQSGTASTLPIYVDAVPTAIAYPGDGFFVQYTGLIYQMHSSMSLNKPVTVELSLDFNVTLASGVPVLGAVAVALLEAAISPAFGGVYIPQIPVGNLTGTGWKYYGVDDGTGWSAAAPPAEISIPLGTATVEPVFGGTTYNLASESYIFEDANASGDISLSLIFATGLATVQVINPTLVMTETPFHTGMMVGESELKRKARAVHSYKSGFPYLSDEAVPDGFTDGIMMHPDDYDPIDPVAQGRGDYVPSASESVVDDEVTDLEG